MTLEKLCGRRTDDDDSIGHYFLLNDFKQNHDLLTVYANEGKKETMFSLFLIFGFTKKRFKTVIFFAALYFLNIFFVAHFYFNF